MKIFRNLSILALVFVGLIGSAHAESFGHLGSMGRGFGHLGGPGATKAVSGPPVLDFLYPDLGANLYAWIDPFDPSKYTLSTNQITQFLDSTSNAFPMTGSGATTATLASAINSKPTMHFNGSQALQNTTTFSSSTIPKTLFAVIRPTDVTSTKGIIGPNGPGGILFRINAGHLELLSSQVVSIGTDTTTLVANTNYIVSVTYDASGNWAFRVNGTAGASGTNVKTFTAARTTYLGTDAGSSNFIGDIGTMVELTSVAALSDLQKMEGRAALDYGLQGSLPVGHPYKNAVNSRTVVWVADGDSITFGLGGQPAWPNSALAQMPGASASTPANTNSPVHTRVTSAGNVKLTNTGTSGISLVGLLSRFATTEAPVFDPTATVNVYSLLGGTNTDVSNLDATSAQKYTYIKNIIAAARAAGFNKLICSTVIASDSDGGTQWTSVISPLNVLLRAGAISDIGCNVLIDFAADSRFSPNTAADNTTNYNVDKIHPTIVGEAAMGSLAEPIILPVISP